MNILHIVAGDLNGGAAKGAYWLHQGLLELGVHSRILTSGKKIDNNATVESICCSPYQKLQDIKRYQFDQLLLTFYKNKKPELFSPSLFGYNLKKHPWYKWADIIHLHWINGGFLSISSISAIDKPIVWTLRDMWPFTGGCHYSMNCQKYKTQCGSCEHLRSNSIKDISRYLFKKKEKRFPKNIKFCGISDWISEQARQSKVLSNYTIQTIHNNINCSEFFPIEKTLAKNVLGINTQKKIVLIGAQSLNHPYKGFNKFLEACNHLNKENIFLAFFGNLSDEVTEKLGFEYKSFGFVNDSISLRLIYSAADIFVAPSILEAFGKTLAEAMACGTPVACFNATGPKDIVDHKINGYKAQPYNSADLAEGIKWLIQNSHTSQLEKAAEKKANECFDSKVIASKYKLLYSNQIKSV